MVTRVVVVAVLSPLHVSPLTDRNHATRHSQQHGETCETKNRLHNSSFQFGFMGLEMCQPTAGAQICDDARGSQWTPEERIATRNRRSLADCAKCNRWHRHFKQRRAAA